MFIPLVACTQCGERKRRPAVKLGRFIDAETNTEYDVHACGVHGRPLTLGKLLSLTSENGNGNGHKHRNGHSDKALLLNAETLREKKARYNRESRKRVKARREAEAQAAPVKRGPGRPKLTPEEARTRKITRQKERRAGGYGNAMHILRDGSRIILPGPPFKCSCGHTTRLFRALMRHANNQKHKVGKPVPLGRGNKA